jgi:predicted ATPase
MTLLKDETSPDTVAPRWRLRLLGDVALQPDAGGPALRLPGRPAAALLARLALWPARLHAREELVELLWPGVEGAVGRNRLRQLLSSLRALLEPPAAAPAPVLLADRMGLRLVPGALACDVTAFEAALRQGQAAAALAWYGGELMPGHYDEWIVEERHRLAALADGLGPPALAAMPGAGLPGRASAAPRGITREDTRTALLVQPAAVARPALPHYLTLLHGADALVDQLLQVLRSHRLVTLTGPGGQGKTRLAVEAARRLASAARPFELVAFVPLVACRDESALLDALGVALRPEGGTGEAMDRLDPVLGGRRVLLVLDNLEQAAAAGAALAACLLARHAGLHLLATSRRALGADGERVIDLPPLPLPDEGATPEELAMNPAVALFVDRARAARADFRLSRHNQAAVLALLQRLEGLPLAIELAACRVRLQPPAALLARLDEPGAAALALLARSGPRTGHDARHASMAGVIAWSWDLLSPAAQRLLARLSVFGGRFSAEAAGEVGGLGPELPEALDELLQLSLLRSDGDDGRLAMHELIRQFAAGQLRAPDAQACRARLRQWVVGWARQLPRDAPLPAVRAELPNVVAAIASAQADDAAADAAALAAALQGALADVALPPGALHSLAGLAPRVTHATARALACAYLARALFRAGVPAEAALQADRALADLPIEARPRAQVLARAAHVRWRLRRDPGAQAMLDEASALAEAAGDLSLQASILATLGAIARPRDRARAVALQRRSLALWTAAGDLHGMNTGRANLAIALAASRAGCGEALALLDEMRPSAQRLGDWASDAQGSNVRGEALCRLHRWREAAQAYADCVRVAHALPDNLMLVYGLWNLPRALAHQRRPREAAALMGCAERLAHQHFGAPGAADQRDLRRLRRLCERQCTAVDVAAAWRDGAAWPLSEAVARAAAAVAAVEPLAP